MWCVPRFLVTALALLAVGPFLPGAEPEVGRYRKPDQPVLPGSPSRIICEAEEFTPEGTGWQPRPWGTNYYSATFANTFLSRKAYLAAAEQTERASASIRVKVPRAGRYLALVRYEAAYRFQTQFRLRIEQQGQTRLDRLYGARDNLKIWAFREKLKPEVAWPWGAVENVVWEGHDAAVELQAGEATLSLIAEKQPEPAARRNVDLVLLTPDEDDVRNRIDRENYLPLDGLLTQEGDVYLKVHNRDDMPLTVTAGKCTEHSPYWVHLRDWKPKPIEAAAGQSTDWTEVGSLLDTLNDGQWPFTARGKGTVRYDLEFGLREADGNITSFRKFEDLRGDVTLAFDADTRYSRRIRKTEDVLYDLLSFLKREPLRGRPPSLTPVYGYTFEAKGGDARYQAAVAEFKKLFSLTATNESAPVAEGARGYIDVRSVPTPKLQEYCKKLVADGSAARVAVVSLGDEIGLSAPPAGDHAGFRTWLQSRGVKPADVIPGATGWEQVRYSPAAKPDGLPAGQFYYSRSYASHFGIQALKQRTDILTRYLPRAGVGANFSPHHHHAYLGDVAQWVTTFRADAMTQPWGEDYIWQLPVGTQQMNSLCLTLFRAGIRGKPGRRIHYYVMPHWPGNTPRSWRRQFYGDLAHGMKIVNLFEFRPVQAAYTENHVSLPEMFQEVRRGLYELGTFEDIVQSSEVVPAQAGLWFGETSDIWNDQEGPFASAKRALYIAVLHRQIPLDAVVEADALAGDLKDYRVIYLTDAHVSRAATAALARWVAEGGTLFATAGAGQFDELNQPNTAMQQLLGLTWGKLDAPANAVVRFIKQDLPFQKPLDTVTWTGADEKVNLPVFGAKAGMTPNGAKAAGTFADGSPAVGEHVVGKGKCVAVGFLPGLTYFKPAIPLRPVDRGSTDDSMAHFIPTEFDAGAARLIGMPAWGIKPPVVCSQPLVEARILRSADGMVIPLVNWGGGPVTRMSVRVAGEFPTGSARLASGRQLEVRQNQEGRYFVLEQLDVADALILRK